MDTSANTLEHMSKLKVIISEVDGIITNGTITYDELGNVPFKNFNFKDLEVVNILRKNFKFVFVSKFQEINYNFFRRKNIPFYWAEKSKTEAIKKIIERYSVTLDEVMYVGSSYSDVPSLRSIPFSVCPHDSVADAKEYASIELPVISGEGVLCELYNLLKQEINRRSSCS